MPRAIGMFGHSLNPDYFINPPAFTYVVHALFALRWGTDPASVGGAYAADPTTAFAIARAASAVLGALAVSLTAIAGARLFDDRRVGVARRRAARRRLPAGPLQPLRAQRRAHAGAAGARRWSASPASTAPAARASTCWPALALGVAIATKYTAGIILVTVIAAAFASPVAHARVRNLALAIGLMCAGFLVANPYALLD